MERCGFVRNVSAPCSHHEDPRYSRRMLILLLVIRYKLFRSTWEPPESLMGGGTLAEWENEKKRIAAGEAKPFNYDDYVRVYSEAEAEKKAKRQRRNAKRQKRGLPPRVYSSDESEEEAEDGEIAEEEVGGEQR